MSNIMILNEISDRCRDADWLNTNADTLYNQIERQLRNRDTAVRGIDSLLLLFPCLLQRDDLLRWGKLLRQGLQVSPYIERSEYDERANARQKRSLFVMVRRHQARPPLTRRRRRDRMEPTEILETYLLLLVGHSHLDELDTRRIRELMDFVRTVSDPYLYAKWYQTLAYVYNDRGEARRALDCAWVAHGYFLRHDDPLEIGLTAFALAEAYQTEGDQQNAMSWLQVAREQMARTSHTLQKALLALESASVLMCNREYAEAEATARESVEHFQELDLSSHLALAHYYLALAHIFQRDYDRAREHLDRSLTLYQTLGKDHKAVSVGYALAFVEASAGHKGRALQYLRSNIDVLKTMPPGDWYDAQMRKISQLIEVLQGNSNNHTAAASK